MESVLKLNLNIFLCSLKSPYPGISSRNGLNATVIIITVVNIIINIKDPMINDNGVNLIEIFSLKLESLSKMSLYLLRKTSLTRFNFMFSFSAIDCKDAKNIFFEETCKTIKVSLVLCPIF